MNARRKLNAVALAAVLVVAGTILAASKSWLVTALAMVAATGLAVYAGMIRPFGHQKPS